MNVNYACAHCHTAFGKFDRCPNCNAFEAVKIKQYGHAQFKAGYHKAVVDGKLQRPDFNSRGAALAFADAVARGARKAEDVAG